jgi:hypothetical protein
MKEDKKLGFEKEELGFRDKKYRVGRFCPARNRLNLLNYL